jgi:hypothetical protein
VICTTISDEIVDIVAVVAAAGITTVGITAAAGTAVAGIVAAGTAAVGSMTLGIGGTGWDGCYPMHFDPFVGNKLNAKPTTFSSFPSCVYGYQNRACYGIL